MWKYYALLFTVVVVALFYAYLADPCNRLVRLEFAQQHPDYEVIDSDADEGSPESVQCHVTYRKPGDPQVYKDIWLYQNLGRRSKQGWEFAKVIESGTVVKQP